MVWYGVLTFLYSVNPLAKIIKWWKINWLSLTKLTGLNYILKSALQRFCVKSHSGKTLVTYVTYVKFKTMQRSSCTKATGKAVPQHGSAVREWSLCTPHIDILQTFESFENLNPPLSIRDLSFISYPHPTLEQETKQAVSPRPKIFYWW